jgi:hypothetical protein
MEIHFIKNWLTPLPSYLLDWSASNLWCSAVQCSPVHFQEVPCRAAWPRFPAGQKFPGLPAESNEDLHNRIWVILDPGATNGSVSCCGWRTYGLSNSPINKVWFSTFARPLFTLHALCTLYSVYLVFIFERSQCIS